MGRPGIPRKGVHSLSRSLQAEACHTLCYRAPSACRLNISFKRQTVSKEYAFAPTSVLYFMTGEANEVQAMPSASPKARHHPVYYFEDGSLVMLVSIFVGKLRPEFLH